VLLSKWGADGKPHGCGSKQTAIISCGRFPWPPSAAPRRISVTVGVHVHVQCARFSLRVTPSLGWCGPRPLYITEHPSWAMLCPHHLNRLVQQMMSVCMPQPQPVRCPALPITQTCSAATCLAASRTALQCAMFCLSSVWPSGVCADYPAVTARGH